MCEQTKTNKDKEATQFEAVNSSKYMNTWHRLKILILATKNTLYVREDKFKFVPQKY